MSEPRAVRMLYADVDGSIRFGKDELGRFVNSVEDVHVFPEVPALLRRYKQAGWRIAFVSNQGGVAMGSITNEGVAANMAETIRQCGGRNVVSLVTWCQHFPHAIDPTMRVCWCRKPRAGLVIDTAITLATRYEGEFYPPALGLMVGDRDEDQGCAEAAALPFMWAKDWRAGAHDPFAFD